MIKLDLKEKSYDKKIVLRDIFLTLYPKEILVINGASGIGKTTLLRIISGLDKDFSGTLENKFSSASISFAQKVFLGRLSAFKEIKVVTGADDNIIYQSMKELGLYQSKESLAQSLSTGQKTRLSLIRAFLAKSEVIYLDEPLLGLDPENKKIALTYMKKRLKGRTLIYTGSPLGFEGEEILNLKEVTP